MLLRAVHCSLDQTCTLVNMTDFHSSLHFPLILIPDSMQHFCRKKKMHLWNADFLQLVSDFSDLSFTPRLLSFHQAAFLRGYGKKKILTKQKQYFQNSTLLLSDYFHQPSYSFWFISIHKQTNAFLCFYCSSRIGLLLEKNNVSTTTTLLNADLH